MGGVESGTQKGPLKYAPKTGEVTAEFEPAGGAEKGKITFKKKQ